MKTAIYYSWIYLKSGVEKTILEMVERSKNDYTIFTNHYDKNATYSSFKKLKVVELNKVPVRRNIFSTLKAAFIIASQKVDLSGFDVLVIHSEGLSDLFLVRNSKIPVVCFCHTPLRPVFDLEYKKRAMKQRSFLRKGLYLLFDFLFRKIDKILWRKYKYIIFNSQESFNRAKNGGLIDKNSKHQILHPGVDWKKIKPTWKYGKYFLVPGRIMWTKNIELAIEAFKLFSKVRSDFKLIITGLVDKKSESYYKKLKSLAGEDENIKFIVNPSDTQIGKLYANCYLVLATAFNEDWGLTPIEANAYAKPALCVNRGGFRESQINGKTGFLLDDNPNAFFEKMLFLGKNGGLVQAMGKYARNHSKRFDWSTFVKTLDGLL